MSISLVVGLGNPGRQYEHTRHNLGWVAIDAYASKHGLVWKNAPEFESVVARRDLGAGRILWLSKPQTFMNESGRAAAALARYHKIAHENLAAVYDDLTIDNGYRIDLLVNDLVIVELKALETILPVHRGQLLSYLRLGRFKLGYLLNFNVAHMRDGITRRVNGL